MRLVGLVRHKEGYPRYENRCKLFFPTPQQIGWNAMGQGCAARACISKHL